MITTPLAPIVAFFRRHKQGLEVLEGAPRVTSDGDLAVVDAEISARKEIRDHLNLFLGRAEIRPAALGWAARVLALEKCWPDEVGGAHVYDDGAAICLYRLAGHEQHTWGWCFPGAPEYDPLPSEWTTILPGPTPPTPAERLKAMIEYEVSK